MERLRVARNRLQVRFSLLESWCTPPGIALKSYSQPPRNLAGRLANIP
jgi:hypothetical protein